MNPFIGESMARWQSHIKHIHWIFGFICLYVLLLFFVDTARGDSSILLSAENHRMPDDIICNIEKMETEELNKTMFSLGTPIVAADTDMNGYSELFFCTRDGKAIQFNGLTGQYRQLFFNLNSTFYKTPQLVDIDGDGFIEFICYDSSNNQYLAIDLLLEKVKWRIPSENISYFDNDLRFQPKILDVESTLKQILLILSANTIGLYNSSGNEIWKKHLDTQTTPYLGVSDVDCDGRMEVLYTWSRPVSVGIDAKDLIGVEIIDLYSLESKYSWNLTIPKGSYFVAPPVMDDIQGDSTKEIILSIANEGIIVLSFNLNKTIWYSPLVVDETWVDASIIQIIKNPINIYVVCTGYNGIRILNGTDGKLYEYRVAPWEVRVGDYPIVGTFFPEHPEKGLFYVRYSDLFSYIPGITSSQWTFQIIPREHHYCFVSDIRDGGPSIHVLWEDAQETTRHLRFYTRTIETIKIESSQSNYTLYPQIIQEIDSIRFVGDITGIHIVRARFYKAGDWSYIINNGNVTDCFNLHDTFQLSNAGLFRLDDRTMALRFSVFVTWEIETDGPFYVELVLYNAQGHQKLAVYHEMIMVERRLVLHGELRTTDIQGNTITSQTWVRGGDSIILSGFSILFWNSSVIPREEDIQFHSDEVFSIIQTSILPVGGHIRIIILVPNETTGVHRLQFMLLQKESNQSFLFKLSFLVDSIPPSFMRIFPENGTWFGTDRFIIGCLVSDGNGSGIGSIEYQYGQDLSHMGVWHRVDVITNLDTTTEGFTYLILTEGMWYLRWVVVDVVGNGPIFSTSYILHIDTTRVQFSDFLPLGWINSTWVTVSVLVSDRNGSGVDSTTICYSYSMDGFWEFTDWIATGSDSIHQTVKVEIPMEFGEGIDNIIRFKARDAVGNERYSDAYQLRVDVTPPVFVQSIPIPGSTVNRTTALDQSVSIIDALSGLDDEMVMYRYHIDDSAKSAWLKAIRSSPSGSGFFATIPIDGGNDIVVEWRAMDLAGSGWAMSKEYVYRVNRPPEIERIQPDFGYRVITYEAIQFLITVSDPENDTLSIQWRMGDEVISSNASFVKQFEEGRYKFIVSVDDGHGNRVERELEIVVEEKSDIRVIERNGPIVLLIITISVAIALAMVVKRRRRIL